MTMENGSFIVNGIAYLCFFDEGDWFQVFSACNELTRCKTKTYFEN